MYNIIFLNKMEIVKSSENLSIFPAKTQGVTNYIIGFRYANLYAGSKPSVFAELFCSSRTWEMNDRQPNELNLHEIPIQFDYFEQTVVSTDEVSFFLLFFSWTSSLLPKIASNGLSFEKSCLLSV